MITYDIKSLVPLFIRNDHNGNALMKAIDRAMSIFCDKCREGVECFNDIDHMPEWRLNEYAWEMGAEWYDSTAPIERKRDQVKAIQNVFRKIGTKSALEDAVVSLFGNGCFITEWYQYSGTPYHYRVYVTGDEAATTKNAEYVRLANIVTNVRSVLDFIQYYGTIGKQTNMYSTAKASSVHITAKAKAVYSGGDTLAVLGTGRIGMMILGYGE